MVDRLRAGEQIAVISMQVPLHLRSRFLLVRACVEEGVEVECLPEQPHWFRIGRVRLCQRIDSVLRDFFPIKGKTNPLNLLVEETRTMIFMNLPTEF